MSFHSNKLASIHNYIFWNIVHHKVVFQIIHGIYHCEKEILERYHSPKITFLEPSFISIQLTINDQDLF
jgi:hypothetical protein